MDMPCQNIGGLTRFPNFSAKEYYTSTLTTAENYSPLKDSWVVCDVRSKSNKWVRILIDGEIVAQVRADATGYTQVINIVPCKAGSTITSASEDFSNSMAGIVVYNMSP